MIIFVRRFFLMCSGATVEILERPECKTELARYAMIGAFVVLTAVFAALSGGFALYTGFKRVLLAVPVGILWAAFIFTLDRFIVSSIRKKPLGNDSSLAHKAWIKLGEIMTALPRLILAVFIAVTVAVPLEMKYFEPEITTQIDETNTEAAKATAAGVPQTIPELAGVQTELDDLADREKKLRERRDSLTDDVKYEGIGVKGPGYTGVFGAGPIYRQRLKDAKQADDDLANYQTKTQERVRYLTDRLNTLRLELAKKIDDKNQLRKNGDGFLARFKALAQLTTDGPIKNVSLFLVILLTLVETTPVLIKLFAKRGPYDDLLEAIEHKIHVAQQVEVSNFNSDTNMELELYEAKVEARRQLENQLIRDTWSPERVEDLAAQDIGEAQTEIAKATIGNWKWRQMDTAQHTP
jgi:hypothetical protein